MQNLVLHICLPKGLALTNGQTLMQDITYDIVSQLTPYYASVDQVKLAGGMYIGRVPDLTVAYQIYAASQIADLISPITIGENYYDPSFSTLPVNQSKMVKAINQWVTAAAAQAILLNIIGLIGTPGAHVLANFSVTRGKGDVLETVAARLKDLETDLAWYEVTIRSNGAVLPGGHVPPAMAAKGLNDWGEISPSRTWITSGMGANSKTPDYGSIVGGRGKPVKFAYSPFFSPSYVNYRFGVYQGAYPLSIAQTFFRLGNN